MAFENLNVRVSASTADANAGLNRVEDNLEEVGDEANSTSRSFGRLSASSGALTGSLSIASTTAVATAGSFALLSTAVAPLAVVFGGIAAAAASLGAVFGGLALAGVVTHTEELNTALQEARTEILEIIEPLGEVFGPLLVDAVEELPSLVQAIVDSLGPLDQFRDTLIRLGNTARRLIPQITAGMFDLAEAALPALNSALTALSQQGPGIFNELSAVFRQIFPLVVDFADAIVGLLPEILDLGTTVANLVVPALTEMVNVLTRVTNKVNQLTPRMKNLTVAAVTLAPAIKVVLGILAGLSTPVLAVVAALGALGVAYKENLGGFKTTVEELTPSIDELKAAGEEAFTTLQTEAQNLQRFMAPTTQAMTELGRETQSSARTVGRSFVPSMGNLQRAVQSSTGSMEEFARASRNSLTGLTEFLSNTVVPTYRFVFTETIAPITNRATDALADNLNPLLAETADTIAALNSHANTLGNVMANVWQTIKPVVMPIVRALSDAFGTMLVGSIDATSDALMGLMNLIQGDWSAAATNFENSLADIGTAGRDAATALGSGFADGLTAMGDILTDWLASGVDWLQMRVNKTFEAYKAALIGVAEFTEKQFGNALDLAGVVADAIADMGTKFTTGIFQIGSDIAQFGEDVANEFIAAMNDVIPNRIGIDIPPVQVEGQTVVSAQTVGVDLPDEPIQSAQTGGFVSESGLLNVHQGERVVPAAQVSDRGTVNVEGGQTEVMVTVKGDTEVIRDVSSEVIREKERRTKRNTGGVNQV